TSSGRKELSMAVSVLAGITDMTDSAWFFFQAEDGIRGFCLSRGLGHRINAYPHMLSGGEKQRVAIMRAWMNKPQLLLADEPTASLDAKRATEVVEMIKKQVRDEKTIGIMVTHDERLFDYADQIFYLNEGQLTTE
ncbi:ATP-binding cassette domain-containing protein, partial [Streptococcus suis]